MKAQRGAGAGLVSPAPDPRPRQDERLSCGPSSRVRVTEVRSSPASIWRGLQQVIGEPSDEGDTIDRSSRQKAGQSADTGLLRRVPPSREPGDNEHQEQPAPREYLINVERESGVRHHDLLR